MTNPPPEGNVWSAPGPSAGSPAAGSPATGWEAPAAAPGAEPYGTPFGLPAPPPRPPRDALAARGDVIAGVLSAGIMLLAGVPLGLLWGATAPRVDIGDLLRNSSETALEAQPAADARFAALAAVFGLVAGVIAAWRGRENGWPLPVGLLVGGLGGSLIAAQTGHLYASADILAKVPRTANPLVRQLVDIGVRADGVHVVYPLLALVVFLAVLASTTRAVPLAVPAEPPAGSWWSAPR